MGITFIPIVAAVGITFDYARVAISKSDLNSALDAAGLAAAGRLYEPKETLEVLAQGFLDQNLDDAPFMVGDKPLQILSKTDETLRVAARAKVRTTVMGLFGVQEVDLYSEAEFTRKVMGLELAMVLDTTGSMAGSKLSTMKTAAKDMLATLFGAQQSSEHLRVALVPFSDMVNVNATRPDWRGDRLDFSVDASVPPDSGDPFDRADQDARIRQHHYGTDWAWIDVTGEALYNGWNIDDHRYVERNGNGGVNYRTARIYDSAYTDEPFEFGTNKKGDRIVQGGKFVPCSHRNAKGCSYEPLRNDHLWLYAKLDAEWLGCVESRPIVDALGVTRDLDISVEPPNASDPDTLFVPSFHADGGGGGFHSYMTDRNEFGTGNGPKVPEDDMDRLSFLNKYYQADAKIDDDGGDGGPNRNCGRPVTPLTDDRQGLENDIDALQANYSTNIPEGLAWGWRMLDPQPPFTAALPYGTRDSQGVKWEKAIVLLTDGENWTDRRRYNSYGFHHEDRLTGPEGENDPAAAMDKRLAKLCERVKQAGKDQGGDGIRLYVIAFRMSGTAAQDLFKPCASEPSYFFDADSNEDLKLAFQRIASDLARLWISE
ncbi:VWA domain-containing protein [Hyphomicrobiales bacterium FT118]|uniref:VWA domain-containing protein n=2 Tax=Futiania mangrovi TaxID=2959716 RepID=A0A9J6P941_9PROT|nr:VWA domain-containing protein [Futiania mangrovii]